MHVKLTLQVEYLHVISYERCKNVRICCDFILVACVKIGDEMQMKQLINLSFV